MSRAAKVAKVFMKGPWEIGQTVYVVNDTFSVRRGGYEATIVKLGREYGYCAREWETSPAQWLRFSLSNGCSTFSSKVYPSKHSYMQKSRTDAAWRVLGRLVAESVSAPAYLDEDDLNHIIQLVSGDIRRTP